MASFLGNFLFGAPAKNQSTEQSQSQSQSNQLSLGGQASSSFGVAGSEGASSQLSQSSQSIAFQDVFASLFGGAGAAAKAVDTAGITNAANQLFNGGAGFLNSLQNNPGSDYLAGRVAGPDVAASAQLDTLKTSLGDFFNEQLLPGITGRGVSTGTLGGSRGAVAQSLAAKQVAGQFSQGAASILSNSQAQRDAAAASLQSGQTQAAGVGLSALPALFGIQQGGANAGLDVFSKLAAILGGPTVLTESSGIGQSLNSSFGNQGSQSYGFDFGTGSSTSQSSSSGQSSGTGGQGSFITSFLSAFAGGLGK